MTTTTSDPTICPEVQRQAAIAAEFIGALTLTEIYDVSQRLNRNDFEVRPVVALAMEVLKDLAHFGEVQAFTYRRSYGVDGGAVSE